MYILGDWDSLTREVRERVGVLTRQTTFPFSAVEKALKDLMEVGASLEAASDVVRTASGTGRGLELVNAIISCVKAGNA